MAIWALLWPLLAMGLIVLFAHQVALKIVLDGGMEGSGNSMSHGPLAEPGVLDKGDYSRAAPVNDPTEITTFVEGRGINYKVAGEYGDVIDFWPYGVQRGLSGPVVSDLEVTVAESRFLNARMIEHRALVWVEFNQTSGTYDVPSLNLVNMTTFVLEDVGYWNDYANAYLRSNLAIVLVEVDEQGHFEYPVGKYSGFVTKGDFNVVHDQHVVGEDANGQFIISGNPLVKPEWITGKVVEIIDADTLQPIHDAALAAFIVGESALVVILVRRHRNEIAAVLGRRNA